MHNLTSFCNYMQDKRVAELKKIWCFIAFLFWYQPLLRVLICQGNTNENIQFLYFIPAPS